MLEFSRENVRESSTSSELVMNYVGVRFIQLDFSHPWCRFLHWTDWCRFCYSWCQVLLGYDSSMLMQISGTGFTLGLRHLTLKMYFIKHICLALFQILRFCVWPPAASTKLLLCLTDQLSLGIVDTIGHLKGREVPMFMQLDCMTDISLHLTLSVCTMCQ